MSEHPRDDKELEAFLAGESTLSRRYRAVSDEQPPEQVDAAILASSRWAVGADTHGAGTRRAGSQHTGLHRTGSHQSASMWQRSSFMRWSVPLATAAVVIVAATLTLTIERDPEIDRLYEQHDSLSGDVREESRETIAGKAEVAAPELPAAVTAPEPPGTAQPRVPAPARVPAKPAEPAPEALLALDEAAKLKEQKNIAARKRSEALRQELAANRAERSDAPDRAVAGNEGDRVAPDSPAVPFPGSVDSRADDTAQASVGMASEESAVAGATASLPADELPESQQLMKSAAEATLGLRQATTQPADSEPVIAQPLADQDSASQFAETEVQRDPAAWIEDIDKLLADGKRDEAIAELRKFRLDYPDYQLPPRLLSLLPPQTE